MASAPTTTDADLRTLAAQTAAALQAVCRDHGWALRFTPGQPMSGSAYVQFPPLRVDVVEQIITGLRRLMTYRCLECADIKRRRAKAIEAGCPQTAAAMAVAMGLHQRAAH